MEDCVGYLLLFIFTIVPYLFFYNQTFRFYVKVFSHYAIMILACFLPIPIALCRPKNVQNTNLCAFITTRLSRVFDMRFEFRGLEHISGEEAGVIVCNHQSSLDVIVMMELWPKLVRCASVVKKELLYAGPFGIVSWLSGTVFVDRSNSQRAQASLNNSLIYLTEKKIKLWFFPEGTRNDSGTMLPFKKGAFHTAIQAQVPILPVIISSYKSFYSKREKKFDNGGRVIVTALPPIPTKDLTVNDVQKLMDTVREQMTEVLTRITKEVEGKSNENADSNQSHQEIK